MIYTHGLLDRMLRRPSIFFTSLASTGLLPDELKALGHESVRRQKRRKETKWKAVYIYHSRQINDFLFCFFFSVEGENRTYQKKMKGYIYILEAASDTIAPIEKIIFVFLNDVI